MSRPNWAPPKKAGESEASYQKRYYTAQRVHAEKTGDTATTAKINAKLPKAKAQSPSAGFEKAMERGTSGLWKAATSTRSAKDRAAYTNASPEQKRKMETAAGGVDTAGLMRGAKRAWDAATYVPGSDPKVQAKMRADKDKKVASR